MERAFGPGLIAPLRVNLAGAFLCIRCRQRGLDAGYFDLQAAVLGMVVFADFVGEIDDGASVQTEFFGAAGQVPADGLRGRRGDPYCVCGNDLDADMLFLHEAYGTGEAQAVGEEDRFGIAVAVGLEFA